MKTRSRRILMLLALALNLVTVPTSKGITNFVYTGSMSIYRSFHTATLLQDGRVLVAGGQSYLNSSEIYDPASGVWSATTGTMAYGREKHTATLLPNGKVLVAGGYSGSSSISSRAEIFDPATGLWTLTGSMRTNRYGHAATLLDNGRVLVTGGFIGNGNMITAEVYDPTSGTWSEINPPTINRRYHTATLLLNGLIIVAGGGWEILMPLSLRNYTTQALTPGCQRETLTSDGIVTRGLFFQMGNYW